MRNRIQRIAKPRKGTRKKWWKIVLGSAIFFLMFYTLFFGETGFLSIMRKIKYRDQLKATIEKEMRISDSLKNVIIKLQTDTQFVEKIARTKMGMSRAGEKIFIFRESKRTIKSPADSQVSK